MIWLLGFAPGPNGGLPSSGLPTRVLPATALTPAHILILLPLTKKYLIIRQFFLRFAVSSFYNPFVF